ncbi:hypothetical protein S7711_11007 [Stachybotrys chartarum IBT 7711]|uniref:Uncharacterized protein n=1 Tax=Stachybotrys chartarum (strain CBS 109288 / IBT 7711) TaxID=1280523 RepID=A0A084B8M4_STACB|nr:hypothetical protein S7711_11007 [Stachybotrys chartarum IBT 7711]
MDIWADKGVFSITRCNPKTGKVGFPYCIKPTTDQRGPWEEQGDIAYVHEAVKGSCTEIVTALGLAQDGDRWKLAEISNLPR